VRAQSLPGQLSFLRMRQGAKPQPVSIEEALAHEFTPIEEEFIATRIARQAVGTPDQVEARISSLLHSTGADELMIASGAATLDARIRSLQIVADLFGARADA
jgi:alkanesulfonate monooxygenase SsuD/methylene tetrahydromethanopterin reductase-like flavin-dependent oxidoreductase (luciferase family)